MNTYIKSGNGIEVTKVIPEETKTEVIPEKVEVVQYERAFLDTQIGNVKNDLSNLLVKHTEELASLQERQAKEVEVAQANVDEVTALIAECDKLGIVANPTVNEPIAIEGK